MAEEERPKLGDIPKGTWSATYGKIDVRITEVRPLPKKKE